MKPGYWAAAHGRRTVRWAVGLAAMAAVALAGCAPNGPYVAADVPPTARAAYSYGYTVEGATAEPTAEAVDDGVAVVIATPVPTPVPLPGNEGLSATLADAAEAIGNDPTGAKAQAFSTLGRFVDPHGAYGNAWWFANDGRADIYEALAVIFFTEGNTSFDVREAVAARYLWYCGGSGTTCEGAALINFLSYFQPWREPWVSRGFLNEAAEKYLVLAQDLVDQEPGLVSAMIPGADSYVHDPDGLGLAGPVDWSQTAFHFANVHPSWDTFLRDRLRRLPNGPARLWVLTMGEASQVCTSQFLCPNMTLARQ